MKWKVEYTKTFLKELAHLPKEIQNRGEEIAFKELPSENPFEAGYVEQMTGYPDKYKIRIGNYRIGITITKKEKLIICQRIVHRKDIYRVFP
ncbi:Toxin-antitoxin system, toxin component, RelE/ParE-like [Desulfonema limicola]|uniref:Toxin-antitoxin system, toxin component, RelE/ParE-like n=1 Tax=Desulfonema limicola TaxID=45656 RepID=A0A975B6N9_9BACT|nr:type II toxin-antitoxin system RelE/ParE family toxin [Desulfonema limicola]QTA79792.1 Toxin-antitoxin system, toxin component, RelE/ParE-like [Desulfonema limicola]